MSPPIVWRPTLTLLDAALAGLALTNPKRIAGERVRALLNALGVEHDALVARLTSADRATLAADEARYATDLATWNTAAETAFNLADLACRFTEERQVYAQLGVVSSPYVFASEPLGRYVLAPTKPLTWADDATTASSTATRPLSHGATPLVRVNARASGAPSNRIEVAAALPTNGLVGYFDLRARLGVYEERFPNLSVNTDPAALDSSRAPFSESLLLAPLVGLASGAVDTADPAVWHPLAGGAGGTMVALRARAEAAMGLPAGRATERATLREFLSRAESAVAARPLFRGSTRRVKEHLTSRASLDPRLTEALMAATDYLTFLAWTPT